ncbi:MAG TPA: alpha,alpha-trehalase TreF [Balneolaceae bacterium]|nr:alpha,alpha-trehalase TreF [Balneolaceae bacterium]
MTPINPDIVDHFIQLNGPLFEDVQQSGIFSDSKTFVDSEPKSDPQKIIDKYHRLKSRSSFNLKAFVYEHFNVPGDEESPDMPSGGSMEEHIDRLWDYLSRQPDEQASDYSTLMPLPYPYIVPGGRFREIYYWDTYFTAEGLASAGRMEMVQNLARNFAWLIEKVGHVPNGNRYYYVSRSQPPFLSLLVDLIARKQEQESIREFIPALEQEYRFWMQGAEKLADGEAHRRVVNIDGHLLNRYWDDRPLPREESWKEDIELVSNLDFTQSREHYRDLRAAAESGWDFSSRWFRDDQRMSTIHTTDILPVDLNALLYFLEFKLGEWTDGETSRQYVEAAQKRKQIFDRFFWDDSEGLYFDFDWRQQEQTQSRSLATAYPLFIGFASEQQAKSVAHILEHKFLKDGGLVTTLRDTGQQWDSPNGWAPLQWVSVRGLHNYGLDDLARKIILRWFDLNKSVYHRTGKMMEKYNVCDLSLKAGGGEYALQDGFGWTNGVAVAFGDLLRARNK